MRKLVMLSNTEYTINRPIVRSMVDDLKTKFFHRPDMFVRYMDNDSNNEFMTSGNIDTDNKTPDNYLEVIPSIVTNDDAVAENVVIRDIKRPVFIDENVRFNVAANTLNTIFTLQLKLVYRSKDELIRLLNEMKVSSIADSYYDQHTVEYYYTLPIELLALVKNIVEIKYGEDKSYYKYLEAKAKVPMDYINSNGGEYNIPIVRERQPVIGNLEGELTSKEVEKHENGWSLELSYIAEIETPTFLKVEFPILVNNKNIDPSFLPKDEYVEIIQTSDNIVKSFYGMIGNSVEDEIRNGEPITRFPTYDDMDFNLPQKPGMIRLASFLLKLDYNNPRLLLDLDNLLDLFVNEKIVNYFKLNRDRTLFMPLENPFHFEIFANDKLVALPLTINEKNEVVSDMPLDLTKTYRLVINCMYNFDYLQRKDKIEIKELRDLLEEYIDLMGSININARGEAEFNYYTVMLSYIIAKRKD